MRVVYLTFIFSLLLSPAAMADDVIVPVPPEMQHQWVLKSCETGVMSYRFSSHFQLTSTAYGSKIKRIGGFRDDGNGRYSLTDPRQVMSLALGPSGDLLQYYDRSQTSFTVQSLEDKSAGIPYMTYKKCSTEQTKIVKEDQKFIALLPGLDRIHEACPTRHDILTQNVCQKAVFLMFDLNNDQAVDEAEMKEAWKVIVPNSFRSCGAMAAKEDVLNADEADYIAWIFENLDQNGDKKIAFSEVYGQWGRLQSDPLMSGLTNMLISGEKPLGILPEDIKMGCANCCIATSKIP